VFVAPGANRVEILKSETDWIHPRVARSTIRILAMLLHLLPQAAGQLFAGLFQLGLA
jgi:hypothetical protein